MSLLAGGGARRRSLTTSPKWVYNLMSLSRFSLLVEVTKPSLLVKIISDGFPSLLSKKAVSTNSSSHPWNWSLGAHNTCISLWNDMVSMSSIGSDLSLIALCPKNPLFLGRVAGVVPNPRSDLSGLPADELLVFRGEPNEYLPAFLLAEWFF